MARLIMCGIAGFLNATRPLHEREADVLVRNMARAIAHRGPDGEGAFVDSAAGIALGHRRLSIIDLSEAGAQPMASANGRWVIAYNGEIYNFEDMRRRLAQRRAEISWRGHSDTEVLVEAIAELGFEQTLTLANGMFAIAAWDRARRTLYLARDRMGEKPLYYGWQGQTFVFGSELKALTVHPDFGRRIDPDAVGLFLRYGYVPSPRCIYQGIAQLRPGHYLTISPDAGPGAPVSTGCYWDLPEPAPHALAESEALEQLDCLLKDAVKLRMRADVPMGAFLSGGIDSSTIVGLMQSQSGTPIRSYSIGFNESGFDEATFARDVANHIGSEHTEMYVRSDDAMAVIPTLAQIYDEPFADSSQIPTYLLSRLTRQHVTVSLSGDGGDELFGGYGRYFEFEKRWAGRLQGFDPLRPAARTALNAMPAWFWVVAQQAAPSRFRGSFQPQRIRRIASGIGTRSKQEFYQFLMQQWTPEMLPGIVTGQGAVFMEQQNVADYADPFLGMMHLDAGSYLPDDILVKVDRASMAVSLEARVPLLDHRVVEFAARLPLELKRRGGTGKWLLRGVLDRYVPRNLIDRPKQGFGVPVSDWLRGPLKSWCEDLLHDEGTAVRELIDLKIVQSAWREHLSGAVDHGNRLWVVLMLVAWSQHWRPV